MNHHFTHGLEARVTKSIIVAFLAAVALVTLVGSARAADTTKPTEDDYYKIIKLPIPTDVVLEPGGLEWMPDGKLAVSTRRGEIFMVENPTAPNPRRIKFTKWATGMHEVMGLAFNKNDGFLYAIQRGEITRLKDSDGRGHANVYETFCDDWGITGDYHEYPWMSKFDKDGNLWVLLTLTGSFTSETRFRGWCLRVKPDGTIIPTASGLRSPAGIAFNDKGEAFYDDNQGPWQGGNNFNFLEPGKFMGNPSGNMWYDLAPNLHPAPMKPQSGSRIWTEAQKIPQYNPPAVIQPYQKMGQSGSGIVFNSSEGKFGPFDGQFFNGDQHHSNLNRVGIEKVKGYYQGWCTLFRAGFSSGNVPALQAPDGSIFVGGTGRGWGSVGGREFALERLVWTGKVPFEVHDMHVTHDGFDLNFTMPVDKGIASYPGNYSLPTWTYIYRSEYGSPEVDQTTAAIRKATVSEDGKSVHLVVDGMVPGHVHELHMSALRSAEGLPLLHSTMWYTLWNIPD
ncbi:MAG TPA: hypothetical protein VIM11_03400 [Tepidisphaeraceae bacterium]